MNTYPHPSQLRQQWHDHNNGLQKVNALLFLAAAHAEDVRVKQSIHLAESALASVQQGLATLFGLPPAAPDVDHRPTAGLLHDCVKCIQALAPPSTVFAYSAEAGLWPVSMPTAQVTTVMDNVLLNAIEAQKSLPCRRVAVTAVNFSSMIGFRTAIPEAEVAAGDYVRVMVANPGTIPPTILSQLFQRPASSKQEATQHGLGLMSVKEAVGRSGGAINLEAGSDLVRVELFLARRR